MDLKIMIYSVVKKYESLLNFYKYLSYMRFDGMNIYNFLIKVCFYMIYYLY